MSAQRPSPLECKTRRQILLLLRSSERSAGEITEALGLKRPTASSHLRVLLDEELVTVRGEGAKRIYALDDARVTAAWSSYLRDLLIL